MKLCTRRFGSPLTPREPAPRKDRGYALVVIMIMATVLLISLTAALPSVYTAGQREREEELIFRGNEYARAIALFRRQFGRFPVSVDELIETNGIRFLRRKYTDPMSRDGKWRFIHADPSGVLLDSRTQPLTPRATGDKPQNPAAKPAEETEKKEETSAFFDRKEIKGAFIAGVASSSRRRSIRVWNDRTRYDEWEFLGVSFDLFTTGQGAPGQRGLPGGQAGPAQPGQQTPMLPSLPPLTEGPIPK